MNAERFPIGGEPDGCGQSHRDAYDRFDRLITTTCPPGSTETFTDDDGNLLTRKTRANQTIRS